jgi:putative transposase
MDEAPRAIWATMLDEGSYLCSVSTMYRLLSQEGEIRERRDQLRHPSYHKPELLATGPNEVWSWDITKLKPDFDSCFCKVLESLSISLGFVTTNYVSS